MTSNTIDPKLSVMVQSGETDDVEVAPEMETTKPTAKPWAHFLAGGYCGNPGSVSFAHPSRLICVSIVSVA